MKPSYIELENELKQLKEDLQITNNILDTILDPVFVKDANFIYTNCNLAFTDYIGLPKEKIIHSTVFDIASRELAEVYYQADCQIRDSKEIQVYEHKVTFADGTLHDIVFHKSPILRNSVFCGITGIMFDITEKKKNEELLLEYIENLKKSNLEKDKYFSILAHELKNPFNSILGFSEYLLQDIARCDLVKALKHASYIDTVANQTYNLLQNLLLWANTSRGQMVFEPEKISLLQIVNSNYALLNNMATRKNILIKNNIDRDYEIMGDANMINSLLQNLITNAIKYTSLGGQIILSAEVETGFVKINIKDNGIGIPEDRRESLFKLDTGPSTIGTAGEHGTGLGLLLCKEFVGKHGGKIWVESEAGKGSEFIFTLPEAG